MDYRPSIDTTSSVNIHLDHFRDFGGDEASIRSHGDDGYLPGFDPSYKLEDVHLAAGGDDRGYKLEDVEMGNPGGPQDPHSDTRSLFKGPNVVDWDGPDDPANPMNWPTAKKVAAIGVVSLITFLS